MLRYPVIYIRKRLVINSINALSKLRVSYFKNLKDDIIIVPLSYLGMRNKVINYAVSVSILGTRVY